MPDGTPRLPHEHDESEDSQASGPRDDIKQAYDDLENGLVETDLRGSLGVDDATRAKHNRPSRSTDGKLPDENSTKLPDGKDR